MDSDGISPFLAAVAVGNLDTCKAFQKHQHDYPELHKAASRASSGDGGGRNSRALIPPDWMSATTLKGESALHLAARAGNVPLLQWLLSYGMDESVRTRDGKSALDYADAAGHSQVLGFLKDWRSSKASTVRTKRAASDAMLEAASRNVDALKKQIEGGIDPASRDAAGNTALHKAAKASQTECVKYLCSILTFVAPGSLSPNARNADGWTPLHLAARHQNTDLMCALLEAGGDPTIDLTLSARGVEMIMTAAKENFRMTSPVDAIYFAPDVRAGASINAIGIAEACGLPQLASMMQLYPGDSATDDTPDPTSAGGEGRAGGEDGPRFMTGLGAKSPLPTSYISHVKESAGRSPAASVAGATTSAVHQAIAKAKLVGDASKPTVAAAAPTRPPELNWAAMQVSTFLHSLQLGQYSAALIDYGFDKLDFLIESLTEAECDKLGFKPFHKAKLMSALAERRKPVATPRETSTESTFNDRLSSQPSAMSGHSGETRADDMDSAMKNLHFSAETPPTFTPMAMATSGTAENFVHFPAPPVAMGAGFHPGPHMPAPTMHVARAMAPYDAMMSPGLHLPAGGADGPIDSMPAAPQPILPVFSPMTMAMPPRAAPTYTFADVIPCMLVPDACDAAAVRDLVPRELQRLLIDARELEFANVHYLGSGSYGIVYKSEFRGSDVAVKVVKRRTYEDAVPVHAFSAMTSKADRERAKLEHIFLALLAEVEIIERVSRHDNIVQFRGLVLNPLALVTEYMTRGNAEEVLVRQDHRNFVRTELPLPRIVQIACDAAAGLMHLHAVSVLHRDVAARNLLLTGDLSGRDMRCKLADFGFSRFRPEADAHETSANQGPVRWMAPESLEHRISTTQTDVFAFGVTMYELLTCQLPWFGYSPDQVFEHVIRGGRLPLPLDLDPDLRMLISACWNQVPDSRPTMAQVHHFLRQWLEAHIETHKFTFSALPTVFTDVPTKIVPQPPVHLPPAQHVQHVQHHPTAAAPPNAGPHHHHHPHQPSAFGGSDWGAGTAAQLPPRAVGLHAQPLGGEDGPMMTSIAPPHVDALHADVASHVLDAARSLAEPTPISPPQLHMHRSGSHVSHASSTARKEASSNEQPAWMMLGARTHSGPPKPKTAGLTRMTFDNSPCTPSSAGSAPTPSSSQDRRNMTREESGSFSQSSNSLPSLMESSVSSLPNREASNPSTPTRPPHTDNATTPAGNAPVVTEMVAVAVEMEGNSDDLYDLLDLPSEDW
jgi:serine/threonine protein kinase/ankyrin repeat protein